jgi:hypothetical protein
MILLPQEKTVVSLAIYSYLRNLAEEFYLAYSY